MYLSKLFPLKYVVYFWIFSSIWLDRLPVNINPRSRLTAYTVLDPMDFMINVSQVSGFDSGVHSCASAAFKLQGFDSRNQHKVLPEMPSASGGTVKCYRKA